MLNFTVDAKEVADQAINYRAAGGKTAQAIANAINWTVSKANTQVKRSLAKQTGIKQSDLTGGSRGITIDRARASKLEAAIVAKSKHTPLSYFNPLQTRAGVTATAWGQRKLYSGAFVATMKSGYQGVFGRGQGQPRYVRRINSRGKVYYSDVNIRTLWGPSMAVEMLREPTPEVFNRTVEQNLVPRIMHEIEFQVLRQMQVKHV